MARAAARLLAEMRAMEEQGERTNPINPKKVLAGSGATPSMGLSQFRGGKHTLMDHIKEPMKGFGKKKEMEKEMESESECDSDEAEGAGRMLGQTLHKLHGGRYLSAFRRGMEGGIQTGAYEGEGHSRMHGEEHRGTVSEKSMDGHRGAGMGGMAVGGAPSGGKKRRATAGPNDKRRERGAKISHLMKSKGMTLAEASKYLKEHS